MIYDCRLRRIAVILFANPEALGYVAPALPSSLLDSADEEIEFTDVLRRTNSRGTTVWRGLRKGEEVAVKLTSASEGEAEILQALAGCEIVPRLVSTVQDGLRAYVSRWPAFFGLPAVSCLASEVFSLIVDVASAWAAHGIILSSPAVLSCSPSACNWARRTACTRWQP
jgi:hypothetical protein